MRYIPRRRKAVVVCLCYSGAVIHHQERGEEKARGRQKQGLLDSR
jgi:hypothetical protein